MLPYRQAHRGHVTHLPALEEDDGRGLVQGRLTLRAHRRTMLHHLVGGRHQMERLSVVSQLSPGLLATLATLAPLAARAFASQRIARGRCAAVVAVFGQPRLKLLNPPQQRLHLRP